MADLDLEQEISRVDPYSFAGLTGELTAGETVIGKSNFQLPAGTDVSGGSVAWALVDSQGLLYAQGTAFDFNVSSSSFFVLVEASAVISAPSTLPPTAVDRAYQIRWTLTLTGQTFPIFSFENLVVKSITQAPVGTEPVVEIVNDQVTAALVTRGQISDLKAEIYDSLNNKVVDSPQLPLHAPVEVAAGYLHKLTFDPTNISPGGTNPLVATLDPYLLSWSYLTDGVSGRTRQTTELFIVNPTILGAVEDCRRMVMKARTTQFGFDDMLFDVGTLLGWLRRGRDLFNAASGIMTEFTMTAATGGVREYWLRYSEVSMLLAHALAEGEKAFNFSGQAISLDVDKAAVYQQLADALQSRLDQEIKPFKQNLLKKGAVAGDGNINGVAGSFTSTSRLGISVHPASQIGRPWLGGVRW